MTMTYAEVIFSRDDGGWYVEVIDNAGITIQVSDIFQSPEEANSWARLNADRVA